MCSHLTFRPHFFTVKPRTCILTITLGKAWFIRDTIYIAMLWFMNIIRSTTQAKAVLLMLLRTYYLVHLCKTHSTNVHSTHFTTFGLIYLGSWGRSPHSLPFISTLLTLFQQINQLYSVIYICLQLYTKIHFKILHKHKEKYQQFDYLKKECKQVWEKVL